MRKWNDIVFAFLLVAAALLSACTSNVATQAVQATQAAPANQAAQGTQPAPASQGTQAAPPSGGPAASQYSSSQLPTSYTNALSSDMQLLLGTLKLEGSPNQVDAQAASVLVPLWQKVQTLSRAASAADLNAVYAQIEAAMTPAQINAIAAMQLSISDLTQYAQDNNLTLGPGGGGPNSGGGAPGAAGTPAPGRTPGAGGGGPNGNSDTPQAPPQNGAASGTQPARGQNMPGMGSAFYDVIIKLLQSKI